ncbi:MAG: recombination-associated protein RdgC [Burkholderiaceae bacterium]|nr:MAG: recombination-associated protein RdgC [Burkholderiaceae bacterium]TBR72829.1 MAG: recombination-associated protein RdgC [Burkholderiaceae bacterium]
MFKNVIVYRIGAGWSAQPAQMEAALEPARFVACAASQEQSAGWVEPRGEAHGALVESVGGQLLLKFMTEAKVLPGSVVNRKAQEQVAQIEASTGRKPGRKEVREIREELRQTLLPMAFTRQARMNVWIDPAASLALIDAASQARADEVATALVKSLEGLSLTLLNTKTSPAAAMSEWLTSQEPPAGFSVDRECELKAADESKSAVRYANHALDIEEVRQHIEAGKLPTRLALTWEGRVSLLLTESLQIKKIAFLEGVFDGTSQEREDGFDADAAIATGELRKLVPDLLLALGGEVVPG